MLIAAILASAMGFIDGSVVGIAIPQMRDELGADFTQSQWIANAYVLFLSALILIGGAAGDRFGIRRTFSVGIVLFVLASLACAAAWSPEVLIIMRALKGIGAAIMIPGSMALIAVNTPRSERGQALGLWAAGSSITTALGPLVGSIVLTYGGEGAWRWIFAINLPIGLLALALLRLVPRDPPREVRSLDIVGSTGAALALGLLAGGLTLLGEVGGALRVGLILLMAGCVVLVATIWWERRTSEPMVDLSLFRSRAFTGVNLLTFLLWGALGAIVFFLPMLLITGWKLPPTYAAGAFLPFSILIALLSPFAGRLTDRIGVRLLLTAGPAAAGLGFLFLAWAIAAHDYWWGVLPAILFVGIGMGLSASPVAAAAVMAVSDENAGAASGINNMFARMSNLFAIAGLGAGLSVAYALIIRGGNLPDEIKALMIEAGFGERLTGGLYNQATVTLQETAMDHAMIALCLITSAMSLAGAAIAWFTQPKGVAN